MIDSKLLDYASALEGRIDKSVDLVALQTSSLSFISKLAPLSVVIAALGLLHSFRQARIKRDGGEATAIRETFNKLGTKAYLLNWSMLGSPAAPIAIGVLHIRELVEARLGNKPSAEDLAGLIGNQLLFEGLIEKAWQDSKALERFQIEALEFGNLRASLGNRVPIVQAALKVIEVRLRMLFLLNTFVIHYVRNNSAFGTLGQDRKSPIPYDHMTAFHGHLLRAAHIPDRDSFSMACKFLQEFCDAATKADDKQILSLARRRLSAYRRLQVRSRGIEDPDIDVLLASATGVTDLAKSALERGATATVTDGELFARYAEIV